jgi:hypothetical protein
MEHDVPPPDPTMLPLWAEVLVIRCAVVIVGAIIGWTIGWIVALIVEAL